MDYIRQMITDHPEYAQPVRDLFMREAAKIPQRLMAISYQHHQQRMREAGLS